MSRKYTLQLSTMQQDTIPFVAKTRQTFNLAQGIPKDYFLYSFTCKLQFRLGISGGTTSGTITAEAGQNVVERFELSGNHKTLGDTLRLLLQGSHVFQLGNIFNGTQFTRTGVPTTGAAANSDITIVYTIDLAPARLRPEEAVLFLLDTPMWNTLNLYIDWGDQNSLVSGGDRTLALTAFGSASGSPTMTVTRTIAKLGGDRLRLNPIPWKQSYKSIDVSAGFNDALLTPLNVGNFLKDIEFVAGEVATGLSAPKAGDNFLTLDDSLFTRLKIKRDDILQRDTPWTELQNFNSKQMRLGFTWPSGYNMYDFNNSDPHSRSTNQSYDTRQIALQNLRFELWGNVTATANAKVHIINNELAGVPIFK